MKPSTLSRLILRVQRVEKRSDARRAGANLIRNSETFAFNEPEKLMARRIDWYYHRKG